MRWFVFCCLLSCAVSSPVRDSAFVDEPDTTPAAAPSPVPEASVTNDEAKPACAEAPYTFCTTRRYRMEGVLFASGKADLMPSSKASLDDLSRALIAQPRLRVYIEVHSDSMGSSSYNLVLSQKRAEAIVAYLVGYGVPASQVEAKGMGETVPINPGTTAAALAENRRIEVSLHESVRMD
jgi:OOP family OmpA-OmpF porin